MCLEICGLIRDCMSAPHKIFVCVWGERKGDRKVCVCARTLVHVCVCAGKSMCDFLCLCALFKCDHLSFVKK